MKVILEFAGWIIASIASIGVLIIGAGYGYGKFREGRSKQSLEGIEADRAMEQLLNGRIDSLQRLIEQKERESKERNENAQMRIAELTKEVGILTGRLLEKDQKIKEYLDILQGRDPALLKVLKDIHGFMVKIDGTLMLVLPKARVRKTTKK